MDVLTDDCGYGTAHAWVSLVLFPASKISTCYFLVSYAEDGHCSEPWQARALVGVGVERIEEGNVVETAASWVGKEDDTWRKVVAVQNSLKRIVREVLGYRQVQVTEEKPGAKTQSIQRMSGCMFIHRRISAHIEVVLGGAKTYH